MRFISALAVGCVLATGAARAATYQLEDLILSPNPDPTNFYTTFYYDYDVQALDFGPITLQISDAAVQSGSFNYRFVGPYPNPQLPSFASGNVYDFQAFSFGGLGTGGRDGTFGLVEDISLSFSLDGAVTGGSIYYNDYDYATLLLSGTGDEFSGYVVFGPNSTVFPTITGRFVETSLPEPGSLILMAPFGMAALFKRRWRSRSA